jgi:hypothetical protein
MSLFRTSPCPALGHAVLRLVFATSHLRSLSGRPVVIMAASPRGASDRERQVGIVVECRYSIASRADCRVRKCISYLSAKSFFQRDLPVSPSEIPYPLRSTSHDQTMYSNGRKRSLPLTVGRCALSSGGKERRLAGPTCGYISPSPRASRNRNGS